jgi:hypothetical protein
MAEPDNHRLPDSLTPQFVGPLRVGPKSRPRRSWPLLPHCPRAPSPYPLSQIVADYVYDNGMSRAGNDSGERGQPARNVLTGSGTSVDRSGTEDLLFVGTDLGV